MSRQEAQTSSTALVSAKKDALQQISARLSIEPEKLKKSLISTVFSGKGTEEEFIAFISVCNQYELNPMTREIYAFPKQGGGIVPMVSADGWTKIITRHPNYKGHSFDESQEEVTVPGTSKKCPKWVSCTIKLKDGGEVTVKEYFDECFRDTMPWKQMPHRMMRHKAKNQTGRDAFGISGIYDDDEGNDVTKGDLVRFPEIAEPKARGEVIDAAPVAQSTTDAGDAPVAPPAPVAAPAEPPSISVLINAELNTPVDLCVGVLKSAIAQTNTSGRAFVCFHIGDGRGTSIDVSEWDEDAVETAKGFKEGMKVAVHNGKKKQSGAVTYWHADSVEALG